MVKFLHCADIHIRGSSRHKEYREAFDELFAFIEKNPVDGVFVGGDIWHTKTQNITPEGIELMVYFFNGLSKNQPLYIIAGNHDANLTNADRQDVLSPILSAMSRKNIHFFKKSGVYPIRDKMNICVFSCLDEEGWEAVKPVPDEINIAAFHGSVIGCKFENGFTSPKGDVGIDFFNGYDFAFLGDIHKMQSLGARKTISHKNVPWVGYPGSLVQQNFAESQTKGFWLWEIENRDQFDLKFHTLENRYPFVTLEWKGNTQDTLAQVSPIKAGSRFRVIAKEAITQLEITHLHNELKTVHGVEDVIIKFDINNRSETISTENGTEITKTNLRSDINGMMELFKEFQSTIDPTEQTEEITDEEIKTLVQSYLQRLNDQEIEDATSTLRNVHWKLKNIQFDNIFKYDEGNVINFDNLSGVVGLFGPNASGKSSCVTALTYGLFNTTDRGTMKNAHIVNRQKKSCKVCIDFSVGGSDYRVERQTVKQTPGGKRSKEAMKAALEEDKSVTHVNLYKSELDENKEPYWLELNGEQRDDTEKQIRRLIGTFADFSLTALSSQGGVTKFIQEGSTSRRQILSRFLDLDVFEKLFAFVKEDCQVLNIKLRKYSQFDWTTVLNTKRQQQTELELQSADITDRIEKVRLEVDEVKALMVGVKQTTDNNVSEQDAITQRRAVERTKNDLVSASRTKEVALEFIAVSTPDLQKIEERKKAKPIEEYKKRLQGQKALETVLLNLKHQHETELTLLNTQEKSVIRLSLVPCGTKFPNCHYIKDAHRDNSLLGLQKGKIENIVRDLEKARTEFAVVKQDKLEEKIEKYEAIIRQALVLESQVKSKQSEIVYLDKQIALLSDKLTEEERTLSEIDRKLGLLLEDAQAILLKEYNAQLAILSKQIYDLDKEKTISAHRLGGVKTEIENIEQEQAEYKVLLKQLRLYELVLNAFSKTGIPAMILKTQLPYINAEIAKILSTVVDFKVILNADSASNNMDIFIEDKHSRRLIESASGMEKTVCSLALRAALLNLSTLPRPDIILVDEGFDGVDRKNLPKCIGMMSTLKEHFKTVLVISHVPEVKEAADIVLEIDSNDLSSHIEYN
jgi:DNA repair exonuclease SbcCD ATPase subunit/DNA repair exonuclease SbcCD nuclease subunit